MNDIQFFIDILSGYEFVKNLIDYMYNEILEKKSYYYFYNCIDSVTAEEARKQLKKDDLKSGGEFKNNFAQLEEIKPSEKNYVYIIYYIFNSKYNSNNGKVLSKKDYCLLLYGLFDHYKLYPSNRTPEFCTSLKIGR